MLPLDISPLENYFCLYPYIIIKWLESLFFSSALLTLCMYVLCLIGLKYAYSSSFKVSKELYSFSEGVEIWGGLSHFETRPAQGSAHRGTFLYRLPNSSQEQLSEKMCCLQIPTKFQFAKAVIKLNLSRQKNTEREERIAYVGLVFIKKQPPCPF